MNRAHQDALDQMRASPNNYDGTQWAAFQNRAFDSCNAGHIQFLAIGPQNTFKEKPDQYPDTSFGLGWKYRFIGWVSLRTGRIEKEDGKSGNTAQVGKETEIPHQPPRDGKTED